MGGVVLFLKAVFIAKRLTKFWVEIIIYTCKPAVLGRNNDIYL